jgi:hypothetical protein
VAVGGVVEPAPAADNRSAVRGGVRRTVWPYALVSVALAAIAAWAVLRRTRHGN